ncbi:MAG: cupin domain-containing protein [Alphaproteobacteria bacterium]
MPSHQGIHADFTRHVVVDTAAMDWQASPTPKVWRKRVFHVGPAESGSVTSVVRYDPASAFPSHAHPDGEEILVLDGVFRDEHGTYPKGSYLLNPDGWRHAPSSPEGCTLFVKLRQYPGAGRPRIVLDTTRARWENRGNPDIDYVALYTEGRERMQLERWRPGASAPLHTHEDLVELFVIDGTMADEHGIYERGTWIRFPVGSSHAPHSELGCLVYARVGPAPGG